MLLDGKFLEKIEKPNQTISTKKESQIDKLLFTSADPIHYKENDLIAQFAKIQTDIINANITCIKPIFHTKLHELLASIRDNKPNFIHFVGHGKNKNKEISQEEKDIAKEIGVYSSYVGAYINDRLVKNKIITKKMSLSTDRFSKAKIDGYEIPQWLETIYHTEELKIETILNYE
jgi:hypothetical protein